MVVKAVYPVYFLKEDNGSYFVQIPDFNGMTQGADFNNAIEMARDFIKLSILDLEEDGREVPEAGSVKPLDIASGAVLSFVDINMNGYREKYGNKAVKKNCTLPAWLATKAEEMNINFSQVLQEALLKKVL